MNDWLADDYAGVLAMRSDGNMTPVPRHGYCIGVPRPGAWREIFNSDSAFYGGTNLGNEEQVRAAAVSSHGRGQSLELVLPPLATIFLRPDGE
jgi:1,4-alpha-glucan branching enzyme